MNEKAKKHWECREASLGNATRYADGEERLKYDMQFIKQYLHPALPKNYT